MTPEAFPLVVFGGSEDRTTAIREGNRRTLPAGEGEKQEIHEDALNPHESMCMLNPYDLRCIVGIKQVEDGDGAEGRLKRLLDGPPLPQTSPLKGSAPVSTVPVVGVGHTREDKHGHDNDYERWYNENTSGLSNKDILTISDGRSDMLSRLTQRSKLEALFFTILFGIFSAWFLWKRLGTKANSKMNARGKVEEDRTESPILDKSHLEGDHENTSLINGTSPPLAIGQTTLLATMHPRISTPPPPPPPVILNGHADPISDITNITTPIRPLTQSTPNLKHESFNPLLPTSNHNPPTPLPIPQMPAPVLPQTSLPSTPASGIIDDNDDSEAEAEAENGAGVTTTPSKRKARRGKRGKKKKPGVLGGEEVGSGERDKVEKDPEQAPSLILTTSSPKPSAMPAPSLVVSDTILGKFLLPFSLKKQAYN